MIRADLTRLEEQLANIRMVVAPETLGSRRMRDTRDFVESRLKEAITIRAEIAKHVREPQ